MFFKRKISGIVNQLSDGYFVAKNFKALVKAELLIRFRGLVGSLEGCYVYNHRQGQFWYF